MNNLLNFKMITILFILTPLFVHGQLLLNNTTLVSNLYKQKSNRFKRGFSLDYGYPLGVNKKSKSFFSNIRGDDGIIFSGYKISGEFSFVSIAYDDYYDGTMAFNYGLKADFSRISYQPNPNYSSEIQTLYFYGLNMGVYMLNSWDFDYVELGPRFTFGIGRADYKNTLVKDGQTYSISGHGLGVSSNISLCIRILHLNYMYLGLDVLYGDINKKIKTNIPLGDLPRNSENVSRTALIIGGSHYF